MRHGLSIPNFAEPQALIDVAVAADAAGWDAFFLWDHIVLDVSAAVPISEPWTVLAAAAAATTRVQLGTMVTPVARRRPWVLARQVTTVDHLSGGRAILGVGLGVPADAEYAALGEPADPRQHAALLDEGLDVLASLWSGKPVHHDGAAHRIDGVQFVPTPVRSPRPPIWVAASLPARAGVRRAARWDGIAPIYATATEMRPLTPDEVASMVDEIAAARGSLEGFDVVVWAIAPDADLRASYERAGATWLIEGPAPGPAFLDDAMSIARSGPPSA